MTLPATLVILGLLAARPQPRIDATFPPPEDRRRPDRTLEGAEGGRITALAYSTDGRTLYTVSQDGNLRAWSARTGSKATGELLRTLAGRVPRGARVTSLAISADGLSLVGQTAQRRQLTWLIESGALTDNQAATAPPAEKLPAGVTAQAVSRKGEMLASAGARGDIQVKDAASGALLSIMQGHKGKVLALAFNPNGQKMVSSGADGTLRTWTVPLPPLPAEDLTGITAALPAKAAATPGKPRKLLVFWRAEAILHKAGVPAANAALMLMGKKTGAFVTHFSRDYQVFDPAVLGRYDAIALNSTAHLAIPDAAGRQALLDYVRGGGGVVGIHAAIDMFKDWPEGAEVVGATFASHPWGPSGTWAVKLDTPGHPLLRAFGGQGFKMKDEFYELGEPYRRDDRRVLMSLDLTDAATAGVGHKRSDKDFAVAWTKRYGQGRVFYGMFGHVAGPFHDARVQQFYLDGIQYALGDLKVD